MVNQFRQVVSAYINQNSEEKNWEEIRELQYIGPNGESAHLGLLLYEFIRYNQSKIHPCNTVLSF